MVTPLAFTVAYRASNSSVSIDMAMRETGTCREKAPFKNDQEHYDANLH